MAIVLRSLTTTQQEKDQGEQVELGLQNELPIDFNWNTQTHPLVPLPRILPSEPTPKQAVGVELVSECLRDGLHGVEVYPSAEEMLEYVYALSQFGVKRITVGIYAGSHSVVDTTIRQLLALMRDTFVDVVPIVLCLATPPSLRWAADCKAIHPGLEAVVFMGTAPSRRLVQGWQLDFVLKQLANAVAEAVRLGIPVIGASEHSTQTPPDDMRDIMRVQIEQGASAFALADTIGITRPRGTYRLVNFARKTLDELGAPQVKLEWHGHEDTGNSIANAMCAAAAGAQRIHVVARGIGERAGNTPLEGIALNLSTILDEAGLAVSWDMQMVFDVLTRYEKLSGVATPAFGVLGKRYSHTTLGIHADALFKAHMLADKAIQLGRYELSAQLKNMARRIYSAVDPHSVGGEISVGVSQWSGQNTVRLAYLLCGGDPAHLSTDEIHRVLNLAKDAGRELDLVELKEIFCAKQVV